MPEATIDEKGYIKCGAYEMSTPRIAISKGYKLYKENKYLCTFNEFDLADLYQVLHTWHMAQAVDKTYLDKIQKIADRMLYKGYPNDVLD